MAKIPITHCSLYNKHVYFTKAEWYSWQFLPVKSHSETTQGNATVDELQSDEQVHRVGVQCSLEVFLFLKKCHLSRYFQAVIMFYLY